MKNTIEDKVLFVEKLGEIKAIGFDIDGTLYKDWHLFRKMPIHFLRYNQFFLKYGIVRKNLRKDEAVNDFRNLQAECMAKLLHCSVEDAQEKLERIVYDGMKHYFLNIKPCKYALDAVKAFKGAGLKIALLSDFPPEQKGALWGLKPYCDVILGSEECGALKPSPVSFRIMAERLGVEPGEMLYVGNSFKCDVVGAKRAGMKTAWFVSRWKYFWHKKNKSPDLIFWDYKKLMEMVLNN